MVLSEHRVSKSDISINDLNLNPNWRQNQGHLIINLKVVVFILEEVCQKKPQVKRDFDTGGNTMKRAVMINPKDNTATALKDIKASYLGRYRITSGKREEINDNQRIEYDERSNHRR